MAGRDILLGYYRGEKRGGSTTELYLNLELRRRDGSVIAETLYDSSGAHYLNGLEGVVTFWMLAERIQKVYPTTPGSE